MSFHVGRPLRPFGADPSRLDGPRYRDGHLPVVRVDDLDGPTVYEQEAFAPVTRPLADAGAVFLRFSARGDAGIVAAHLDFDAPISAGKGSIADAKGEAIFLYGSGWSWDEAESVACAPRSRRDTPSSWRYSPGRLRPLPGIDRGRLRRPNGSSASSAGKACSPKATSWTIPEPVVQNAWRALIAGNFLIAVGDRMHYSAGNAYDHLYEAECGDAVRAMMLYGFADDARRMVKPLLDFNRQATRFHVAGHKLQLLAHYYWVTRDAEALRAWEPIWGPVIDFLVRSRRHGQRPAAPRPLRRRHRPGRVFAELQRQLPGAGCATWPPSSPTWASATGRGARGARPRRSARRSSRPWPPRASGCDAKPPFIPNALFGAEKAYANLTATQTGQLLRPDDPVHPRLGRVRPGRPARPG